MLNPIEAQFITCKRFDYRLELKINPDYNFVINENFDSN